LTTISSGFSNWLKFSSCGTSPMQDIARERSSRMLVPQTRTSPPVAVTSEVTMPIRVDLPAPLGPSSAKKSPSATASDIPLRACTPFL
jgi:hypothetical protein